MAVSSFCSRNLTFFITCDWCIDASHPCMPQCCYSFIRARSVQSSSQRRESVNEKQSWTLKPTFGSSIPKHFHAYENYSKNNAICLPEPRLRIKVLNLFCLSLSLLLFPISHTFVTRHTFHLGLSTQHQMNKQSMCDYVSA